MKRVLWVGEKTMTDPQRETLAAKLDDEINIVRLRRVVSSDEISWKRITTVADKMGCHIVALSKNIHPVEGADYIPEGVTVVYETETSAPRKMAARARGTGATPAIADAPATVISWEDLTV